MSHTSPKSLLTLHNLQAKKSNAFYGSNQNKPIYAYLLLSVLEDHQATNS